VGNNILSNNEIINLNKANFNAGQSSNKGVPLDLRVKQSFYGVTQNKNNPMGGYASIQGGYHPQTGFNAGAEGGLNLVLSRNGQANRYFSNRGLIPKQTVFVPQLTMGFGVKQKHKGWDQNTLNEYENLLNQDVENKTTNSLDYLNEEGKKGNLTGSRVNFGIRPQFTVESRPTRSPLILHGTVGANMNLAAKNRAIDDSGGTRSQNSLYGEIGARYPVDKLFDKKSKAKSKIQEVQDREQEYERERPIKPVEQKEPEEQTEWIGEHPRWLRDGGSAGDYIELDISKDQIQKYVDGGYIVEEVEDPSIPALNRFDNGGSPKSQWIAPVDIQGYSKVDPVTKLVYQNYDDYKIEAGHKGFKNRVKSFFQKDIGKLVIEAEKLGKGVGYVAGVQGDIEPAVYNREGIKKFKSEVKRLKGDFNTELKDAEKKRKQEAKDREDYEQARKKAQSSKDPNAGSNFAKKYEEKGWSKFDQATMKEGYKGQFQDAVDEANARKEANMGVTTTALEVLGGGAYRVVADPLGTAKGVGQTVADVASLPVGLATGTYNYATEGNFDMGKNIIGQNYGEGLSQTGDVLSAIPGIGAAGKLAKFTKAADAVGDLGKFVTTQTPIKNTYKLLGKDSKFFNPGETPHWRKGYQETWNPDVADLKVLDEFVEAKNLRNVPENIKKQYSEVGQKLDTKVKALNNQADEAIKAGNIEEGVRLRKESMHALKESKDAKDAVIDGYQASLLPKKSPFKQMIGEGSFGKVYDIEGSNRVVKLGKIPSNENLEELIKRGQGLEGRGNIALTTRSSRLPSGEYATVMNKVDDVSGTGMPTKESFQQLVTDVDELQNKGLYLDFQNTDNIVFNPATGKYNLYDLNTTGHYMSRRVTPEMGFSFKADPTFQGIQVPVTEGKSAKDILKAHGLIPDDFRKGGSTDDFIEIDISDLQLGDEIDEDTMNELKRLGYTFEEI
jgi:hypothetical protein